MDICKRIAPHYKEVEEGHFCACHLYNTEQETQMFEIENEEVAARAAAEERTPKTFWDGLKNKVFPPREKRADVTEAERSAGIVMTAQKAAEEAMTPPAPAVQTVKPAEPKKSGSGAKKSAAVKKTATGGKSVKKSGTVKKEIKNAPKE